ncbi:MAG: SpoIIE family protein phosphatase [Anaerolineae bacterium]|nr:SpoIIE family protein phosphatase [Anaerolineae bacterium]
MNDELEALVGYMLIVGGRAVSSAPPGAVVELPPRKVSRGREGDTFFTLIAPAGKTQGEAEFYNNLARYAADQYFRSTGSVTSGLREVIHTINTQLLDHAAAANKRLSVSMSALVLRGHEVYLARAGSALCLIKRGTEFTVLPDLPTDLLSPEVPQLGMESTPEVRLARYEIAPGDVLLMADTGLCHNEPAQLEQAFEQGGLTGTIDGVKALNPVALQAMVIEFVSADTPDPIASTAVKNALSTSAPNTIIESAPKPPKRQTGTIRIPLNPPQPKRLTSTPVESAPSPTEAPVETDSSAVGAAQPHFLARIGTGLNRVGQMINRGVDRLLPEPTTESGPHIPTMLAAALAILVPVVIVFVIVGLRLSQFDMTQFEQQVQEVVTAAEQARMISLEDVSRARTVWMGVLQRVEVVETSSGRTADPILMQIRAEAQGIIDKFDKVTRRDLTLLRNLGQGAVVGDPIIRGGADLYTLDRANNAIYRDTLNPNAVTLITRSSQPVVQRGQAVGASSVRKLVDMAWVAEGGTQRNNVLAALDTQGILVTYSPTFAPATSQRLAGADLWGEPNAIYVWRGNLYLLDPKENQIWRYRPVGNSYPNPPEQYFENDPRPDLSVAVDIAIDSAGNMYVLFADGTLGKYNAGEEQAFAYSAMPEGGSPRSGAAMYLDSDSPLPAIYILDPADQSIFQVTLSGAFRMRLRARDTAAFRNLSGIFVNGENLFVGSGPILYYFSITDLLAGGG